MSDIATIYGFITDEIFWNKKTVDLTKSVDTGLGFLDDININYFNKIGTIRDPRTTRLDILGEVPVGAMSVLFDVSKVNSATSPFTSMTDAQATTFMNIVEKCYITQNRTEEELNTELFTDSTLYSFFVKGSAKRSSSYTEILPKTLKSTLKVYDYIEFDIKIGTVQTNFKLWLNSVKFVADYPLTTITKVIPPFKEEYLLDTSALTSSIQTVLSNGEYLFDKSNSGTVGVDNTGILTYKTKLIISSQNTPTVSFGLVYQGAKPSSLEARKAIREYLISLGIAPEATWEAKLPDLFITAEFFLIPLWENRVARPNNKDGYIYPAITNLQDTNAVMKKMLPSFELEWFDLYSEILINPFNTIMILGVPDPLNDVLYTSLFKIFDTYQAFGPDQTSYMYQEDNAKEFSLKLSRVMSILYGSTTMGADGFSTNTFYGRRYMSFSTSKIEIHVLYKEDYNLEDNG